MTVDLQKHCMKYLIARDIKGEGVMKLNTSLSIAFYAQSCLSFFFFQLLKFVPTAEESLMLSEYASEIENMARADRFLFEMSK